MRWALPQPSCDGSFRNSCAFILRIRGELIGGSCLLEFLGAALAGSADVAIAYWGI